MALTKIRQSNLTQPLDENLSVPGITSSGNISLADSAKAIFGGDSDLQIYHDATDNYIDAPVSGHLYIQNQVAGKDIKFRADNGSGSLEDYIVIDSSTRKVKIKYADQNVIETTSSGVDLTGNLTVSGDLTVSGNTVTLNTTTLVVEDKNVVLASGSADSASASGAGIQVDISGVTNPELAWYAGAVDSGVPGWEFNYPVVITQSSGARTTNLHLVNETSAADTEIALEMSVVSPSNDSCDVRLVAHRVGGNAGSDFYIETTNSSNTIERHFTITENGNVGIGFDIPQQNLAVSVGTNEVTPTLGVASGAFSILKNDSANSGSYGLITGLETSGNAWSQVQRVDGTGTAYHLKLQPSGGKVAIGTSWDHPIGTLDVGGNVSLSTTGTGSRFVGFYQNVVSEGVNDLKAFIEKNGNNFTISNQDDGVITIANNDGDGANRERLQIRNEGFIFENNKIGAKGQTTPQFDVHLGEAVSISSGRYLNWDTPSTEISVANHAITVSMDDDSATSQPKTIGLTLHNDSQTNNTFAPAITWGSQSNSGNFSQASAGIVGRRTIQGQDANWHGGELHFYTAPSGTGNGLGLLNRMSIADTGSVYMTNGEIYFGTADSSSAHINAYELMTFNIDIDNDDADTRYFAWYKNGPSATGTELMRLKENATIINNNDQPDIRPALNFDFSNSKELDPRFTFYRSSKASYVGEDGFVKFANQNVPRFDHDPATGESLGLLIEENRTNEIIDSVNMYSSWAEISCAIQRNYAVAPDGTWSAIRLQPDGLDQSSFAQQTLTVSYSTTYSISAYVKSDGADYAFLAFANTGFNGRATIIVNLSNGDIEFESGTSESSITSFVEEYKNGWYRIGLTVTSDSANGAAGSFEIGPSSESTPAAGSNANPKAGTDNTKALLVWGLQREIGTNISSYIPSRANFESRTSAASYINEDGYIEMSPAYEERLTHGHDGTKLIKAGPIIEPARTNLHENSEWNLPSNPTIAGSIVASGRSKTDYQAENTTAPDGSLWPIIITNAVTGGNYYYQNYSSLTLGSNYTFSVFFRLPNSNTENINSFTVYAHDNSFAKYYYATYDFTTDAITQSTTGSFYTIQKYPNNWRRISLTAAPDANSSFDFLFHFNVSGSTTAQSYSGGGTAGLPIGYIFGPQLEVGNQPTTYIPTGRRNTGATVARAADTATFYDGYRLDDLCDIYDTDEINSERGTVYTEWSSKVPTTDGVGGVFEMWDSNSGGTNGIDQRLNSFYVTNNYGVSTGSYLGPGIVHKTSLGYDRDNILDWKTTLNGVHTGTNSVHKFSMNLTRLSLGRIDLNPAYMLNGHLKRFVLYNSQLSLEEQKVVTEND